MTRSKTRTILLLSIIVIMVFGIFIALPMLVPSYGDANCNAVMLGCGKAQVPLRYITLIWETDRWPLSPDRMRYDLPAWGRFNVDEQSGDASIIQVSGYLLYGSVTYNGNDPNDDIEDLLSVLPSFRFIGGLRNKPLMVFYSREYGTETVIDEPFIVETGADGWFEFELDTDDEAECYRITITFDGETIVPKTRGRPIVIYSGKMAQNSNCSGLPETEREENRFWMWFGIGLGVIAITTAGILYLRFQKRRSNGTGWLFSKSGSVALPVELELVSELTGSEIPPETGGDIERLHLFFPDIESPLPSVWGTEQALTLSVEVTPLEDGTGMSGEITIDWDDNGESLRIRNNDYHVSVSYRYLRKGEYRITASYRKGRRTYASWRTVRIVDYREEMVRIFGELVADLGLTDVSIAPETTPRELEKILVERLGRSYRSSIRTAVDCFEEANYSTHPVDREQYVIMFRAIRAILDR